MRAPVLIALMILAGCSAYLFEWIGADGRTPPRINYRPDRPGEADRFYYGQRTYPFGSPPAGWREQAQAHIAAMNAGLDKTAIPDWKWINIGPVNIAGRIRALAVDPIDPDIMYAGSAGGGVWKTTDGGISWTAQSEYLPNLRIGSIAISPHNRDVLFAGNGEGFVYWQGGMAYGRGIYRTINGGVGWELIKSTENSDFEFVFDVAFDPDRENWALASTRTGIHRTTDLGTSWTKVLSGIGSKRGLMAVYSATQPGVVYATIEGAGIYKSLDHGETWKIVSTPDMNTMSVNRIYIAAAPSDGNIVYAAYTHNDMSCAGVFRTLDGGATWAELAIPTNEISRDTYMGSQGMYNSVLSVHPENPDIVYAGGIDLYKTTNGGKSWRQISNWYRTQFYPYVHADQHAIDIRRGQPEYVVFANDGGIFVTTNGGKSFAGRNHGLVTTQFHSGTPHPNADNVLGGTIDNGNLKLETAALWQEVTGGDGGFAAINPLNTDIMYTELYYLHILKSERAGIPDSFVPAMNGIPRRADIGTSDRANFIAPLVMDPSNPDVLYAGSYRVFKTTNAAGMWYPISGDVSGGTALTTIAVSKSNPGVIYTGAVNGVAYVTTDGGSSWSRITDGLPNRYITDIEVHPTNPAIAYLTVSGFRTGHVFRTTNFGGRWNDISGEGPNVLPDVPVNTIAIHPEIDSLLFIGSDMGIFTTGSNGKSWGTNLQKFSQVVVADLQFRRDGVLFAATHGRGVFRTNRSLMENPPPLISGYELSQTFPNPVNAGTSRVYISYSIPVWEGGNIFVHDAMGRWVHTINLASREPGTYTIQFETASLKPGVYLYTLKTWSGFSKTRKMLLMR